MELCEFADCYMSECKCSSCRYVLASNTEDCLMSFELMHVYFDILSQLNFTYADRHVW